MVLTVGLGPGRQLVVGAHRANLAHDAHRELDVRLERAVPQRELKPEVTCSVTWCQSRVLKQVLHFQLSKPLSVLDHCIYQNTPTSDTQTLADWWASPPRPYPHPPYVPHSPPPSCASTLSPLTRPPPSTHPSSQLSPSPHPLTSPLSSFHTCPSHSSLPPPSPAPPHPSHHPPTHLAR